MRASLFGLGVGGQPCSNFLALTVLYNYQDSRAIVRMGMEFNMGI